MKRLFLLLGLVMFLGLACEAVQAAENLLKNPSFEERAPKPQPSDPWSHGYLDGVAQSPFAHWGYGGFWDGGDYDIKLGPGHTGKMCVRLVCREKGRGGIASEAVRVKPGTTLKFSGWFKGVGAYGSGWINFEGQPGDGWAKIDLPKEPTYDWQEVTGTVTVPVKKNQPADEPVDIHIFIYTRAYGELWIDDLSLTPGE